MKLRDKPCERCGWKFLGFHVCVDLSTPMVVGEDGHRHSFSPSAEHLQAMQEGKSRRWQQHREENRRRDAKIVELYKGGLGFRVIAKEFGIAYQTCIGIVRRAEERGEVVVRPRGNNIRYLKGEVDGVSS